jgi:2-amino-4-hydroxy-6-hydroxymethyldihydropteridine diphosphokinase
VSGGTAETVYLGLGSNIGDRFGHLNRALEAIAAAGIRIEAVSPAYETEPVGEILDQPDFLNAAARVRTSLAPEDLLDRLKAIESEVGRTGDVPRHSPRVIDIDLLLFGESEYRSERLTLPHREVTGRRFVLVPLLDLDPGLRTPDGTRLADALAALPDGQRVKPAGRLDF